MKDHKQQTLFYLVLFLAIFAVQPVFAEVYKVIDENGNVIFTDQPPEPGAVPMDLPELSIISPQLPQRVPVVESTESLPGVSDDPGQEVTGLRDLKHGYKDFAITHPKQDQNFWGTDNKVQVAWGTQYVLQGGMTVVLYVDGVPQEPTRNPVFNLSEVWRGAHVVYAELRDKRNRRIAVTEPVTFHMKQQSAVFTARRNQGG